MTARAGTGIIIRRNNKVLVGVRQGSHGAGYLAFPGGKIDDDDDSLAGQVAREADEETGMVIAMIDIDPGRQDLFTTFDILGENERWLTSYIVADYVSGGDEYETDKFRPREPDKCEDWLFLTLDELVEKLQGEDQHWIPIDRLLYYRSVIQL